jgi:hypothetical protein
LRPIDGWSSKTPSDWLNRAQQITAIVRTILSFGANRFLLNRPAGAKSSGPLVYRSMSAFCFGRG